MATSFLPHTKITEYLLYAIGQQSYVNVENLTNVVNDLGEGVTPDLSVVRKRIDDLEKEAQELRKVVDDSVDVFGDLSTTGL